MSSSHSPRISPCGRSAALNPSFIPAPRPFCGTSYRALYPTLSPTITSLFGTPTPTAPRIARHNPRHETRQSGVYCAWVERKVQVVIEAPREFVYDVYSDIEKMPMWSPWLESVKIDSKDPAVSTWKLAARGVSVQWQARNTQVIPGEIIAWESVDGLPSKGSIRFTDMKNSDSQKPGCLIEMSVAFNVPQVMAMTAALSSFVGNSVDERLNSDLRRFREQCLRENETKQKLKQLA